MSDLSRNTMGIKMFLKVIFIMPLLVCVLLSQVTAQLGVFHSQEIDSLAQKAIRVFQVPGIAIAIVKDGNIVYAKGYGRRSILSDEKVDENTLFGIASNSKAFTAAACGVLVQQKLLSWDDLVIKYIPEFRLADPWVTTHFTIRDMLTHRSGLPTGSGDLLHNPDSTDFTIGDLIRSLRYFKLKYPFRTKFAYENILYLVAGELIHRVSGMRWEDFLSKFIFKPIGMDESEGSWIQIKNKSNVISGHRLVNGNLVVLNTSSTEQDAGAGGIYSSARDMALWMICNLRHGKTFKANECLFDSAIHAEIWTPQIAIAVSPDTLYQRNLAAYGLGWFINDRRGYKEISHTGQDDGMISAVDLLPELGVGITVLSNQEGGGAVRAVIDQLADAYLKAPPIDQIGHWQRRVEKKDSNLQSSPSIPGPKSSTSNLRLRLAKRLHGQYEDEWFGKISLYLSEDELYFRSAHSKQLHGKVYFIAGDSCLVEWDNRLLNADAYLIFNRKYTAFVMRPVSASTSTAYDFDDLHFSKMRTTRRKVK